MSDIDDKIRAGLDADDRAFLASLDDQRGLFRQIGDSLGGPLGGWAKMVFAMTFALSVVMFYSVWQLLTATEPRDLALWGTATVVLVMSIGFLKDWLFSRMNMFSVLREVKRLQVQVAMLAAERD
ncbi:hypothetical protein GRI89_07590 [Altererythrobacter salegens]|uniref:Uncharacterized protein n=1 Tax=Croceibacterium salegens TaxID=1737568 RepID=A0A6I4STU7_9SPHN|nr:DUF6768 family protein [Croceibacterium salegens]MXO59401.1 hypothetical protein [Croceibacterium salegens]